MKSSLALVGFFAASAFLAATGCSTAHNSSPAAVARRSLPARLEVKVSVPPGMNSLRDDDITEAFGNSVRAALHEKGFKGRIRVLDEYTDPTPGLPVLDVNLVEWRPDIGGTVNCTFDASLTTPQGSRNLGLFTGTSIMPWGRRDAFSRAEGFTGAAQDALGNLADRMEQTGLITKVPNY